MESQYDQVNQALAYFKAFKGLEGSIEVESVRYKKHLKMAIIASQALDNYSGEDLEKLGSRIARELIYPRLHGTALDDATKDCEHELGKECTIDCRTIVEAIRALGSYKHILQSEKPKQKKAPVRCC